MISNVVTLLKKSLNFAHFYTMKKRLHFWLITFLLVLMSQAGPVAYAQNPQTIEVGPHFGATSYIGELNTWRNLQDWDWKSLNQFHYDLGAVVRYNYDSRWAFRLDYTYGTFRARDAVAAWRPEAKLNFRSTLHDLALMAEFNFLNYYTGRPESSISPYIFAGVSGFRYCVRPNTGDELLDEYYFDFSKVKEKDKKDNFEVGEEKVSKNALSIPFGVGCKLSLSKHLAATLEWRMHYTLTDYLDGVHGVYPENGNHVLLVSTNGQGNYEIIKGNPKDLKNNQTLVYDFSDPSGIFSYDPNDPDVIIILDPQRGNAPTNDWFGMLNLSITWKFVIPNNSACKMNIN